jgi:site-specific DNA-cytosine methylase
MGFWKGYDFAGNKGEVVKQIGNAIEFHVMRALCREMLKGYAPAKQKKAQVLAEAIAT